MLKFYYERKSYRNDILFITFISTYKCNFKCPYCFETEKSLDIDYEKIKLLKLYFKKTLKYIKYFQFGIFGGEPLIRWNILVDLLDYIKNLQKKYNFLFDTVITTNGYLLNEKIINSLIYKYNCKSLQVTIDVNENI